MSTATEYDWHDHDTWHEYVRPMMDAARQIVAGDVGPEPVETLRRCLEGIDRHDLSWRRDFYGRRGYLLDDNGYPQRDADDKPIKVGGRP